LRSETIARNYAEALFELAEQGGQTDLFADLIVATASAIEMSPEVQAVMMSPRVPKAAKGQLLAQALEESAPREFVLFLQAVVKRGRQGLFGEIARAYEGLLDQKHNRVRAGVTLARKPDDATRHAIAEGLSRALGMTVIPAFHVDPAILGGTIVRVGERIYDGSLRRQLVRLRRQLVSG
jgi:F-type H+-transporting ATPase subunit delta